MTVATFSMFCNKEHSMLTDDTTQGYCIFPTGIVLINQAYLYSPGRSTIIALYIFVTHPVIVAVVCAVRCSAKQTISWNVNPKETDILHSLIELFFKTSPSNCNTFAVILLLRRALNDLCES